MGYTPDQGFYLINGEDLVNPATDINYNMSRCDEKLKPLVEYYVTDVPDITASAIPKDVGYKFYKQYSNSTWVWSANPVGTTPSMRQEPNGAVPGWLSTDITFASGWSSDSTEVVQYSTASNFVQLRGKLVYNTTIPSNTLLSNILTLPVSMRPNTDRSWIISGGQGVDDFQMFRAVIGSASGALSVYKYGNGPIDPSHNYISLDTVVFYQNV
ncbi:hypothetical protein ACFY7C_36805 [Streptomyces sp. NPDC012769]|uniref:hypothetical protein n=1 Tax=Streptomyces sp. NPDC012769 TaxID=3364848 RepID=UPI0036BB21A0